MDSSVNKAEILVTTKTSQRLSRSRHPREEERDESSGGSLTRFQKEVFQAHVPVQVLDGELVVVNVSLFQVAVVADIFEGPLSLVR